MTYRVACTRLKKPHLSTQVRGALTKGENIADVGGLSLALDAYKRWSQRQKSAGKEAEKPLPGIPLNVDQTFFVTNAQVTNFCFHENTFHEKYWKIRMCVQFLYEASSALERM